jgi:hypothetical protein
MFEYLDRTCVRVLAYKKSGVRRPKCRYADSASTAVVGWQHALLKVFASVNPPRDMVSKRSYFCCRRSSERASRSLV